MSILSTIAAFSAWPLGRQLFLAAATHLECDGQHALHRPTGLVERQLASGLEVFGKADCEFLGHRDDPEAIGDLEDSALPF